MLAAPDDEWLVPSGSSDSPDGVTGALSPGSPASGAFEPEPSLGGSTSYACCPGFTRSYC